MAGHDAKAQELFDGLYQVFRSQPSNLNRQLMAWAIGSDCKAIQPATSATDGDLDIAFALLLANRQWGSAGTIDYAGEARKVKCFPCYSARALFCLLPAKALRVRTNR
jgi:endo-1,4-beta-D-glucanase Y